MLTSNTYNQHFAPLSAEQLAENATKKVICGMSGGVDSSVSAFILQQQGYQVEGLFMKNWEEDDDTDYCTAAADLADAQAVCDKLGIKLHKINFAAEYWDNVFEHFLTEYKAGRTPNPDILCNKEIKFNEVQKKAKTSSAKPLYNLTDIQQTASALFGMSPKQTLNIVQSLYEKHKVLTYPRTDSRYLTSDMKNTLKDRIQNKHVAIGDSRTLLKLNAYEALSEVNEDVTDIQRPLPGESFRDTALRTMGRDVFLTSVNALAQTGEMVNIDGTGNRVAASLFGSQEVFFVLGINKITPDLASAIYRARNVAAPLNSKKNKKILIRCPMESLKIL